MTKFMINNRTDARKRDVNLSISDDCKQELSASKLCLKMDVELLDKAKAVYQIDSLCLVVNYFIDPTDERERFLRFAINCKFSDAVGKSLESLPEVGLPLIAASLPEND